MTRLKLKKITYLVCLLLLVLPFINTVENKSSNADIPYSPVASDDMGSIGMVWEKYFENESPPTMGSTMVLLDEVVYIVEIKEVSYYYDDYFLVKCDLEGNFISREALPQAQRIWSDGVSLYVSVEDSEQDTLVRMDNGSVIWNITIPSISDIFFGEDEMYAVGSNLTRITKDGNISWDCNINEFEAGFSSGVKIFQKGEILYATGLSFGYDFQSKDCFLSRWNSTSGDFISSVLLPKARSIGDLWATDEGLYVLTSDSASYVPTWSTLSKCDFDNNSLWNITLSSATAEEILGDENGLYLVGATRETSSSEDSDFWIGRFAFNAELLWQKSWTNEGGQDQSLYDIVFGPNDTIYTLGSQAKVVLAKWAQDEISPILLNNLKDVSLEQSDSVFSLNWYVSDENPSSYVVYKDGEEISSGDWLSEQVIGIKIDQSISLGEYNYTMIATDFSGKTVSDTVIVTVEDTIAPHFLSVQYANDSNTITWIAEDRNPSSYVVYKDGEEISSGDWLSEGKITVVVIPEKRSSLNCTIVVWDTSGNSYSDSVIVPALLGSSTNIVFSFSWLNIFLVIVGLATLASLIFLFVFLRKRQDVLHKKIVYTEH